ncbi:MAG: phospholipid carrier-dependent glycosyltransferase [Desulforhopalus sp.]
MDKKQYIFTILLFFTVVYLLPLGARPLMVPDETRYAEIPREMVTTGDWLIPRLNGLKYYEKPIMGYWLHALSQKGLGESNFAVRLPGVVATGLVAVLLALMLAAVTGRQDNRVYLAPLVFLSSYGVFCIGTTAILDNALNFFLTAGIVLFFLASEKPRRSVAENVLLVLAGIAVGCAFMTKGFLAFVVPLVTVIPYLFWQKRAKELVRLLFLPAISAAAVSLPWAIMIHLQDPDFWNFFFWHEHVKRFFSDNAQHQEPFWFYFVAVIPLFLPWILLLPSVCTGIFTEYGRNREVSRIVAISVCWVVFPFLFFSLSSGKLITYLLPCLPPLAILTAIGLHGALQGKGRLLTLSLSFFLLLVSIVFGGFIASQLISYGVISLPNDFGRYDVEAWRYSEALWKPLLIAASLAAMAILIFMALKRRDGGKKMVLLAISPFVLMLSSGYALPDRTLTVKDPGPLLKMEAKNIPDDAIVISGAGTVAAACWYLKRTDFYLLFGGGELDYGLARPGGQHRVLRSYDAIHEVIGPEKDKMVVFLLQTKNWRRYLERFLPPPVDFVSTGEHGYAVVKY